MIVSNCTPRDPIVLEEVPFALRLILHAHYPGFHPLNAEAAKSLMAEFMESSLARNWDNLVHGTIAVTFADGLRRTKIRGTNSQYVALDKSNAEFARGYEPEVGALLDRLLPADGVFCDIGANWGYFSIYAATRPSFRGKIHAFEPIPETFADLQEVTRELGLAERIHCHPTALSNVDGHSAMTISNYSSGMAKIEKAGAGVPVKLTKLDSLGLGKIDFLKIDVEGHEGEVIEGGRETISTHHPYILFEDWHDGSASDSGKKCHASALLEKLGYQFFAPYWVKPDGTASHVLNENVEMSKMTLIPFDYATHRSRLAARLNLLACHRSQVAAMKATLTTPQG